MKTIWAGLSALLLALLLCCGAATAALAAGETLPGVPPTAQNAVSAADGEAVATAGKGYVLRVETEIGEEATPLAAAPAQTHCVLHILLFALTLAAGAGLLYSRQWHRARQRDLLARLRAQAPAKEWER